MPPLESVLRYFRATLAMMTNRPAALHELDLSADGFWESFWSFVIALPPLLVIWVAFAANPEIPPATGKPFVVAVLAVSAIVAWLLPLAAFVGLAGRLGLGDRIIAYVVATNWGTALLAWLLWPPSLLRLALPADSGVVASIEFAALVLELVLGWRLTNVALAKGPAIATAVFIAMFVAGLVIAITVRDFLLPLPPA